MIMYKYHKLGHSLKSEKASKVPFGGGALDRRGGGGAANGSGALFGCIGAGAGAVASRPANMFSESAAGASRPRRLGWTKRNKDLAKMSAPRSI